MTSIVFQRIRIAISVNLIKCIPAYLIILRIFCIFDFYNDPDTFVFDSDQDIAKAISGFSVRPNIPAVFISQNPKQDTMIKILFCRLFYKSIANTDSFPQIFCKNALYFRRISSLERFAKCIQSLSVLLDIFLEHGHDLIFKNIPYFHIRNRKTIISSIRSSSLG